MLKRSVSIFLLLAMIGTNFSRFFVYAGFELNQSYIAKALCENRNRPELHCNGKCFLKKKLQAAEEKEKKQEHENKRNRYQEILPSYYAFFLSIYGANYNKVYPETITRNTIHRSFSIFQPPKLA